MTLDVMEINVSNYKLETQMEYRYHIMIEN